MTTSTLIQMGPEEMAEMIARGIAAAGQSKLDARINPLLKKLKYLTSSQAAEIIGIKPSTVRTWEREGLITAHETGKNERFLLSEVLELAADRADRKHKHKT